MATSPNQITPTTTQTPAATGAPAFQTSTLRGQARGSSFVTEEDQASMRT